MSQPSTREAAEVLLAAINTARSEERERLHWATTLTDEERRVVSTGLAELPSPLQDLGARLLGEWDRLEAVERIAGLLMLAEGLASTILPAER